MALRLQGCAENPQDGKDTTSEFPLISRGCAENPQDGKDKTSEFPLISRGTPPDFHFGMGGRDNKMTLRSLEQNMHVKQISSSHMGNMD